MIRLNRTRWILSLAILSTVLVIGSGLLGIYKYEHRSNSGPMPAPTEIVKMKQDRAEHKRQREEWIESLHRAAPGTDWRAIEKENHGQNVLRRLETEKNGFSTDNWAEIGSANQAGRTHATAYSPDDGLIYVGSSRGGVWKGTMTGENWQAISDDIGYGSHGLLVAPGNPKVITTIDSNGRIYATTNDGGTWFVPPGLENESISTGIRIIRDLGNPRTVYFLWRGTPSGGSRGWHISRSDNGGQSYTLVHSEANTPGCDIWTDRRNPGPLYLMVGSALKMSNNLGVTFVDVGTASIDARDVVLTACEAGAPAFYAALKPLGASWELWRSTNGGVTWEWRYAINDFWETLCASITNPDLILFAGVECWRSVDGGDSFTRVNRWGDYYGDPENMLHADFPGMECLWIDGQEIFFLDTDGGTYISYNGVETVKNLSLSGLGISQYYSIFTSRNHPYLVAAGAQDQGYQRSMPGQGRSPFLNFDQIISGDYGHLTSTVRDLNLVYSVYPGFILLQVNEDAPYKLRYLDFPSGAQYTPWMPFILADPVNLEVFYFCADHLWRYERAGGVGDYDMTELPYDFSTEGGYLTALAISPADYNDWYAVSNQGNLWYSTDAGENWTLSSSTGPADSWLYGTSLIASSADPLVAYVGGSGYSGPAVYKTVDGGVTWEPMGDGLPGTLIYELAFDNNIDENIYAAAEAGPFRYDASAGQWEGIFGTEAPLTTYWTVEGVPELDVVRFGTYGRGIWDYRHDADAAEGLIAGPGPGYGNPPQVRVFPPGQNMAPAYVFNAYGASHYGVNVTSGDLTDDHRDEIVTGPGPGDIYGPNVRGFRVGGGPLPGLNFLAYGTKKFGANVATGDIDSDGFDEIVTGAGPGAVFGPHVRAFDYDGTSSVTPVSGVSYFAYGTRKWGVNVSAGDIDGDGFDEITTGAGPGAVFGPHVRAWNVDGGTATPIQAVSYFAYGSRKFGVQVSCGDVDSDGNNEIVTAPGPSNYFGSHIRGWNYDGASITSLPGLSFFAWPSSEIRYGARVYAGTDLDTSGRDDLVVGAGPDPSLGSPIRVFRYNGSEVTSWFSLQAFPDGWTHGTSVAAGRF